MNRPGSLELERVCCALCGSERSETSATGEDFEYETSDDTFHFVRCLDCGWNMPSPQAAQLAALARAYVPLPQILHCAPAASFAPYLPFAHFDFISYQLSISAKFAESEEKILEPFVLPVQQSLRCTRVT